MQHKVDRSKLIQCITYSWLAAAFLTSINMADYEGEGFVYTAIAFLIMASPIWVIYLYRWLLNAPNISRRLSTIYTVCAALLAFAFFDYNENYPVVFAAPLIHLWLVYLMRPNSSSKRVRSKPTKKTKQPSQEWRDAIRGSLTEAYIHTVSEGNRCSICQKENVPLAFNVVEKSIYGTRDFPEGFVPMSGRGNRVSGSFTVCDECCPACPTCHLPILTPQAKKLKADQDASFGNGICQHIHPIMALQESVLGLLGRRQGKARKHHENELTDEIKGVFDRMLGNDK